MKEEEFVKEFFKELSFKGFWNAEPICEICYKDNLHFKSVRLAYVKDDRVTTAKMSYWVIHQSQNAEHIIDIKVEEFVGPDDKLATIAFQEVLDCL